jgi:hypothetical protein
MRVCAWCRRIFYRNRWIRLEEFMRQGFDTPTSHGICPECMRAETEQIERAREGACRGNSSGEERSSLKA